MVNNWIPLPYRSTGQAFNGMENGAGGLRLLLNPPKFSINPSLERRKNPFSFDSKWNGREYTFTSFNTCGFCRNDQRS
jgi:hypothetical protein